MIILFSVLNIRAQQPEADNEAVKIRTDLFQTSVVVDKNNRPVEGLKPEQFELRVDGKVRSIEFFEAAANGQTNGGSVVGDSKQNSAAATSLNLRERSIIFFLDDLHLSLDSLSRARSAVRNFIEKDMLPRDRILLVTASGQLKFCSTSPIIRR